mmetsp:Transcript_20368/g.3310  ORF Transcript_20368/g.3310 Transcript_20368/m.3310 type:complete len:106 (+) Transcript_20368:135-452(+)
MKHDNEDDLWVAIHGCVYDVTNFSDHPGSIEPFLDVAGADASEEFDEKGHSEVALKMMDKYRVGVYKKTAETSHLKSDGGEGNGLFLIFPIIFVILSFIIAEYFT